MDTVKPVGFETKKMPLCPKGHKWWPMKEKCIPVDQEKGVKKMDKIKEATDLVDVILKGDYDKHKKVEEAVKVSKDVLDEVENKLDNVPDQELADLHSDVVDELTKDEGVSPVEEIIAVSISRLIREEDYRTYFKKMLKKHNVSNPSDLDDAKKKEFFNAVDKGWKAEKESD